MNAPGRIVVVGASLAGLRGIEALRRDGYDGAITLVGAEPHLPYDRPPLSKQVLAGSLEPDQIALRREPIEDLALDLRLGRRAISLDAQAREIALDDGERVAWDGLLIASGATPRRLPGTPALEGIHVLRTLDDALAIRRALEKGPRVLVVGAGFIGAEVAATCRAQGHPVTVVEPLAAPMLRALGPEIAAVTAELHRDHGVDLRCGVGVEALEGAGRVERARLADGSVIEADLVVIGIGVTPEVSWLEGSGLELRDGVVCDATCATSLPGVTAAGDVARWPHPLFGEEMRIEHWTHAIEMGEAAARRLLATPETATPFAPVPYVWTDQYDRKLQMAGHIRSDDLMEIIQGSLEERRFVAIFGREGRLTGALAMNRPAAVIGLKQRIARGDAFADVAAGAQ
ncbi:MAG: FAD-dependent oxidoreductase [Deltaproteobacteria bacterium]|nr:FAD-dependent oxidoreductase [Deltaproteobacteria bacterium]